MDMFECKIPGTNLIIRGESEFEIYKVPVFGPDELPLYRDLIVKSIIDENERINIVRWIKEYLGIIPYSGQFEIIQDGYLTDGNNIKYLVTNCVPISIKKIKSDKFEIRFKWIWKFRLDENGKINI